MHRVCIAAARSTRALCAAPLRALPLRRFLAASSSGSQEPVVDAEVVGEESKAEGAPKVAATTGERAVGTAEKRGFQAETLKLLHIVTHSLYSDKEVFIRELVSNASDALEKVRRLRSVNRAMIEEDQPLEVRIWADEDKRELVIEDFGTGMTKDELAENLGTIARSGTQSFVESMAKQGSTDAMTNIIGQFGVGFYSVFMVADKVAVYSRSSEPDAKAYVWTSDGSGTYELAEAEGVHRGCKIVISLKEKCANFSHATVIKDTIKKYSNFVQFPILVNGEVVNTVQAIWTLPKDAVTDEMHKQFYQFISHSKDTPTVQFMYATDSPINIRSVFYVGKTHAEKFGMKKLDPGVSLFSRRVLIQPKAEGLLPGWLRFVQGVVDSEDVPLSVSREHLQDQRIIQRISSVITKRVLKEFKDLLRRDSKAYDKFYDEFGIFLKEGIHTDVRYKDELSGLLRVESSLTPEGLISLDTYVDRMRPKQDEIYYLHDASRTMAEASPYFEAFRKKGVEVIFLYSLTDEVVFQNIVDFRGKRIVSVESAHIDLSALPDDPAYVDPKAKKDTASDAETGSLNEEQVKSLCAWLKNDALKGRISDVTVSDRLTDTPVLVADYEGAQMKRMMKFIDPQGARQMTLPLQKLQINPKHSLIVKLAAMKDAHGAIAKLTAEQLLDNALVTAGLLDNSRSMLPRINQILEELLIARKQ